MQVRGLEDALIARFRPDARHTASSQIQTRRAKYTWEQVAAIKGVKHRVDALVRFELLQLNRANALNKTRVIRDEAPHGYEGTHDTDVDVDGTFTSQNAGQHGNALLCECISAVSVSASV